MFSHIMLGANDIQKSKLFYDAIFTVLGYQPGVIDAKGRCFYMNKTGIFALSKPINGETACHGNGTTIGFSCSSNKQVDQWHEIGLENGGTNCEELPGIRSGTIGSLYLAYLRDPSGNKVCASFRVN